MKMNNFTIGQKLYKIKQKENSQFIHGLGKVNDEVKILLNVQKLLFDDMIDENV